MTKAELIKTWAGENPTLTHAQYETALNSLCNVMAAELLGRGEVPLPGVGKLKAKPTAARKARNPKSGELIDIPAGMRVRFVPCKEMKDALKS